MMVASLQAHEWKTSMEPNKLPASPSRKTFADKDDMLKTFLEEGNTDMFRIDMES